MYTEGLLHGAVVPSGTGPLGVDDLDAAPGTHGEWLVMRRCQIRRLMFYVTEAVVADTTAPAVSFTARVTPGSDSGATVLGTLTIPHGTAVGKVVYKDIEPFTLNPGDTLAPKSTVQTVDAGSSTETGQGFYGFELHDMPEEPANSGDMVESA